MDSEKEINQNEVTQEKEVTEKEEKETNEKGKKCDKKKCREKDEAENEKLKKELSEKEDKFLRLLAEYDNFRKRSAKEKSDTYSLAQTDVIKELLPVLDNFERAKAAANSSLEDYQKGIELIFGQFKAVLDKIGVESFGDRGDEFDPNIHQAVSTVEDEDLGENQVSAVFSTGYRLGDKVIRAAVVQVANA